MSPGRGPHRSAGWGLLSSVLWGGEGQGSSVLGTEAASPRTPDPRLAALVPSVTQGRKCLRAVSDHVSAPQARLSEPLKTPPRPLLLLDEIQTSPPPNLHFYKPTPNPLSGATAHLTLGLAEAVEPPQLAWERGPERGWGALSRTTLCSHIRRCPVSLCSGQDKGSCWNDRNPAHRLRIYCHCPPG